MGRLCVLKSGLLLALLSFTVTAHAGFYRLKAAPPKNPSGGQIAYTNATVPYTNTESGYGASAIDMDFVNCTGQITATFEWVPDNLPGTSTPDELDVPPPKVIAAEYCEATFEASYFLPAGGAVGDASNSLGFELDEDVEPIYIYEEGQPVLIGHTVRGVSKGTRYTAVNGTQEITLTLNPHASIIVAGGFCEAEVLYESRIIVPRVQLTGTTRFDNFDPPRIQFLTGQQIKSEVKFATPPGNIPQHLADPGIVARSWSIGYSEGEQENWGPFKNYLVSHSSVNQHLSTGQKVMLVGIPDWTGEQFYFYTNNSKPVAIPGQVKCAVTLAPPGPEQSYAGGLPSILAESVVVSSVKPPRPSGQPVLGQPAIVGDYLMFAGPGIRWQNIDIQVPDFGQIGEGAICQLITADRHVYRTVINPNLPDAFTHFIKQYWNGVESLDIDLPYPFDGSWNLAQGHGNYQDSPANPLSLNYPNTLQWTRSTAHDTFKTWVMYRPPQNNNLGHVWIPIAKFEWDWKAEANWSGTAWVVAPQGNSVSIPEPTSLHPIWTKKTIYHFPFTGVSP